MNIVEPIRDENMVRDIANYYKNENERDYILWMMGIYSGRRISDIVPFRVGDVKNKTQFTIREKKTGKQAIITINPQLVKALNHYCADKDNEEYLIKSRQGYNKPITRQMAYNILKRAAKEFKLTNIGCHTMRKTFGYHFYKQTGDVVTLMKIFNHHSPSVTLRYIGIDQEEANDKMRKFKIF
jgi:integrase